VRLIVVGSGIVGASCAYAATSLGAEVVLVDAARPGRATAAGAGIICPWSAPVTDPAWCALAYAAAREYPALMARLADLGETDVSYRQVGALALAADEEDRERIRLALTARRAEAPEIGEVTGLSGAEARQLFPPLRADAAAVHIGGAARVDGRELAAALARAAARQGAVVRQDQAQLALDHGRVTGVRIGGELIRADAVVAATGAWTRDFLADGTYLETRVGFRPVGPGIRPLLGPVPALDGLVVATGLGATGLTMGPLSGALAAQSALGLPPAIDLEPFTPLPGMTRE